MDLNVWINTCIGQSKEIEDTSALYQCMDWAFNVCDFLHIPRSAIQQPNAYQVFTEPTDETKKYFSLIPNTPDGIPHAGDFVVFDQNVSGITGASGHICVAVGIGDVHTFLSADQNWNGQTTIQFVRHTYEGVLGWLRPLSV